MALLNQGGAPTSAPAQASAPTALGTDAKKEAIKAGRARAIAAKENTKRIAKSIIDQLKQFAVYDKLTTENKEFLGSLIVETSGVGGGVATFNRLFGAAPVVGSKLGMVDCILKLQQIKSKLSMFALMKTWAEKGTIVELVENAQDISKSEYVVKAIAA